MTTDYPDGIRETHARPGSLHRHASPISLLVLGALLLTALLGRLGGGASTTIAVASAGAELDVTCPAVLRDGEFFEAMIRVVPRRPLEELVLAVSAGLWRDMTVNTVIPQAAGEGYEDGYFRFSYGPREPNQPLLVKVDGQINPTLSGSTEGEVAVFDRSTKLAFVTVAMSVRP